MSVRVRSVILGGLVALAMVVTQAVPAGAVARSQKPARSGTNTQVVMSGTGPGQGVTGFIANPTNPFDPVLDGYPSTNPTTGFTPKDEGFAGVIFGQPTDGTSPTLSLYCFDLLTDTWPGVGYALGTWDAANVPNVGFVAQVLNNYYPFVPSQPSGLANTSQQAAAVQAAIWFFSDRFVLSTSDPLYSTVVQLVNHVISLGPVTEPPPPNLSITPTDASGPNTGAVVGPFTVNSSTGAATVTATGAHMFSDSAATSPIANGATVTTPAQIWLKSSGPTSAVLQATANAAVPRDNVYLYDGNTPGTNDAQRLMLAQDATLTTTVTATAEFKSVGSLVVQKTIAGAAAGSQGQVTIHSVCDGAALTPDFVVPSRSPAGTSSRTYTNIPSGSMCTVTETADGHTNTVLVNVAGNGQQVTIPENSSVTVAITDTYTFLPGSLTVVKTVTGDGAGQQGEVIIHVSCPGVDPSLTPDFVLPAGTAAGSVSTSYDNIPANTTCTVSETANGANSVVSVVTAGGGAVTVPIGGAAEADITNDYSLNPGSLVVTKTIAGGAAGSQGAVTIAVDCTDGLARPDFVIPAGTTAGSTSMTYADIPANTVCTANEATDGSTSTIAVEITGDNGTQTTIPAGGTANAAITDTYIDTSGTLVVDKEVTGDGAGLQGEVTIHVDCNDAITRPDFTIAPGGTSTSTEYTGIAPGTQCTVTETADGSIADVVTVVTSITPTGPVTIPASGSVEVDVADTYTLATGSLTVTKNIAGPAAGQQGDVTIRVLCVGVDPSATPPFVIPAGSMGAMSHTYTGLPDQAKCLIAETVDGGTSTVSVTVSAFLQTATIVADQTATVAVTDTYSLRPGSILVAKSLSGPFAGQQGPITIDATCGAGPLPTFTIPAGTPPGLQVHFYDDIQAGSTCILTETADGATSIVTTTVLGSDKQTVTVAAGTVVPAVFADVFTDSPGTLTVTKNIAGAAAGRQGPIAILVDCGQPIDQFAFLIPAGTPAGTVSRSFDEIPAGSVCTVTETSNGAASTVAATVTGSGQKVGVGANQSAAAVLTDTYSPISAALVAQLAFTGVGPALTLVAVLGIAALGPADSSWSSDVAHGPAAAALARSKVESTGPTRSAGPCAAPRVVPGWRHERRVWIVTGVPSASESKYWKVTPTPTGQNSRGSSAQTVPFIGS